MTTLLPVQCTVGQYIRHESKILWSRHMVVCCVAQETRGAQQASVYFTGVKKTPFSRICSSTLPEQKKMKFSVWIPSSWGTSNSKFELNLPSRSQDMHLQSSSYFLRIFVLLFATLFEIVIIHTCFDGFLEIWSIIRAYLRFNFCSNGIKKHWVIIDFQQVRSFVMPTGLTANWKSICSYM